MCLLCGGGPLFCPAVVWGVFFQIFLLPFPLLKCFFTFLVFFTWSIDFCSLEITIWSTIVCLFWGSTIVSSCFLKCFFFKHSLYLSFAKVFSFTFLIYFKWNSQKCPISRNIWCLIKTQLQNITQTIFPGDSPWATLIHNSMFVWGVHYCVRLLPEVIVFSNSPFTFSFAIFFSFTFLVSFTWNSQKCPFSQNIWCLTKTQFKRNSTKTIFQGGSPWATLIHSSLFVLGVHYCVQLLPGAIFFKHSLYLFLC